MHDRCHRRHKNCYKSSERRPCSIIFDDEKPSLEETCIRWTLKGQWDFTGQDFTGCQIEKKYWLASSYGAKKATNILGDEYVHGAQVQSKVSRSNKQLHLEL